MRIELGAPVQTHDGQAAGKVKQLIVDPSQQTLDSFVVHTQWMGQDLIVPLHDVERVDDDDTIHLTISDEQFRELPQYVVSEFVSGGPTYGTSYGPVGGANRIDMATYSSGGAGRQFDYSSGSMMGPPDLSGSVVRTESSLSENEFGVTQGTKVVSADGHKLGAVHELRVADDGKVDGMVIEAGLLRKHEQYIPVAQIEVADSDAVHLRLTAKEYHDLEHVGHTEAPPPEAPR